MNKMSRNVKQAREAFEKGDVEMIKDAHKNHEQEACLDEDKTKGGDHLEAHSEAGGFIKSAVYGGLDGMITTYSVVMGVAGANLPPVVVLALGIANLIGDGLSMGLGDYLSTKSQQEFQKMERKRELFEVENNVEGEKKEMYEIYTGKGMSENDAKQICDILAKEENKEAWVDIMMIEELGLIPDDENPMWNAMVTFGAFALFGLVPIIPFIAGEIGQTDKYLVEVSTVMTALFLFILGVTKSKFSYAKWYMSGLETLFVGAIASGASYLIGMAFEGLVQEAEAK